MAKNDQKEKKGFFKRLVSFKGLGIVAAIGAGVFALGFAASLIAFAPVSTAFAVGLTAVTSAVSVVGLGVAGLGVTGLGVRGAVTGIAKIVNAIKNKATQTKAKKQEKARVNLRNKENVLEQENVNEQNEELVQNEEAVVDNKKPNRKAGGLYDELSDEAKAEYNSIIKKNSATVFRGLSASEVRYFAKLAEDKIAEAKEEHRSLTAEEQVELARIVAVGEKAKRYYKKLEDLDDEEITEEKAGELMNKVSNSLKPKRTSKK